MYQDKEKAFDYHLYNAVPIKFYNQLVQLTPSGKF